MMKTRSNLPYLPAGSALLGTLLMLIAGPAEAKPGKRHQAQIKAIQATTEIPEDSLLDVGIRVFHPGLPQEDEYLLEEEGVYPDIRRAEARFLPLQLMETLQSTGHWGAVRVVPDEVVADLLVTGTILESSGIRLELEVEAHDAVGRRWLLKKYKQDAYSRAYGEEVSGEEPFQSLYNRIANDLLTFRGKLSQQKLLRIREVSALQFAHDLAPASFEGYLGRNKRGLAVPVRLPSEDDPIHQRVHEMRERDFMFIDTLTEHYATFAAKMSEPYTSWRKFSYEEELAKRKIKRQSRRNILLGALGVLGAILVDGDSQAAQTARQGAVIAGSIAIQHGIGKAQEARIHAEALRELAASFDAEVEPLLVDVEGQTLRLSGSVEAQYAEWRQLLKAIFIEDTGLPVDPDTGEPQAMPVVAPES